MTLYQMMTIVTTPPPCSLAQPSGISFRPLSRAATTFPAGAPTKIRLAAAGDFSGGGGGIRRDLMNGGTSHY